MSALVAAELMKLRTLRSTWLLLPASPSAVLIGRFADPVEPAAVSSAAVAATAAAFAAAHAAGEHARRATGLDWLAVPSRVPAFAAKATAFSCVAGILGFITGLLGLAADRGLLDGGLWGSAARVAAPAAATALLGAFGAALGMLVPRPAPATAAAVGMVIGPAPYLPGGLLAAIARLGDPVPLPTAFGLLSAYTALVCGVAALLVWRRDLT